MEVYKLTVCYKEMEETLCEMKNDGKLVKEEVVEEEEAVVAKVFLMIPSHKVS